MRLSEQERELLRNWVKITAKLLIGRVISYQFLMKELEAIQELTKAQLIYED